MQQAVRVGFSGVKGMIEQGQTCQSQGVAAGYMGNSAVSEHHSGYVEPKRMFPESRRLECKMMIQVHMWTRDGVWKEKVSRCETCKGVYYYVVCSRY